MNSTSNDTFTWNTSSTSFHESTSSRVLKTSAYSLVLLLSLVGNSLVIAILYRDKKMRSVTNNWIANMAASDLIFPLVAFPYGITQIFTGKDVWLIKGGFGLATCKLVMFLADVSTAISIQSMIFIAVERFCAVKFPLLVGSIQPKMKVLIPMTWLLGLAVHGPYLYTVALVSYGGKTFCISSFAPPLDHRIYFVVIFVLLYALPLITLVVLYTSIIVQLKKSKAPMESTAATETQQRKLRDQNNWKILKMSLAIVLIFFLCFSPFIFSTLLAMFLGVALSPKVQFVALFFAQSYPAWNPIVYFVFSDNFRSGLKRVCFRKFEQRKGVNRTTLMSWTSRRSFQAFRSRKLEKINTLSETGTLVKQVPLVSV